MSRRINALVVFTLLFAVSALAAPVVSTILPVQGSAGGGTVVTIKGTGFSTCVVCSPPSPPEVFFGTTPAASVTLVNETTIEAVTPPHPAGSVTVTVFQFDGTSSLENAFTFTGDYLNALEPILVPVFSPPVLGQFGSDFRTTVRASHEGGGSGRILLFGLDTSCFLFAPVLGPLDARAIEPNGETYELQPDCSTWPAKLFYVPAGRADEITLNARVRDVSRADLSHGTEIPIVRLSDFSTDRVVLLNVPIDPRFRNTLRIYSLIEGSVTVTVDSHEHEVTLQRGKDEFEPPYAMFTDFPAILEPGRPDSVRVVVRPNTPITSPPSPTPPIWAFVSVTNNVTQEITTVTPD